MSKSLNYETVLSMGWPLDRALQKMFPWYFQEKIWRRLKWFVSAPALEVGSWFWALRRAYPDSYCPNWILKGGVWSYLISTEAILLSGDVQFAAFWVAFNIAVSIELQLSQFTIFHFPTEIFCGDKACSKYSLTFLLSVRLLLSHIVTGNRAG